MFKQNTIKNRYDFVLLIDVLFGNPNGDPDAGNTPRMDPETFLGYITDESLKNKIRKAISIYEEERPGYNILIKPDKALNTKYTEVYDELGLEKNQKGTNSDNVKKAKEYMCRNYYDARTFGSVMSTGDDQCGKVQGPVQINFARSISPINIQDITITRQAKTTEERLKDSDTEMGNKPFIPYGLYRTEGHITPYYAEDTGFSEEDLEILWKAIINMFEQDHSASRGEMRVRGLYVFKHDNKLGRCSAGDLFDKITIEEKNSDVPPRSFDDYRVNIDTNMPEGVELLKMV